MFDNTPELAMLKPAPGSIKKPKRLGRGRSSGYGDTATKGHKGAKCRSGYKKNPGFEGGQMPLKRRIPKRGFNPMNRTDYNEVKLSDLNRIQGDTANPETIRAVRLVKGRGPIVLLGSGEIDQSLKVMVHRITKSAQEKINAVGGSVEILPLDPIDRRVKKGPKRKKKHMPQTRRNET